jgi:hypothetical protein
MKKGTTRTTDPLDGWKDVERTARAKRLNLQQAMRAALLSWIHRAG